ncbi:MAG: hypothetical protein COW62_05495 [Zetaproteobacteria bacterium CG17_big_fil_post_rev_8_21_14_2_50_50_13]|nr:MAG: hypothetical protein COW62_05495 [Zetaproteobacteria bacterium CG17_big_fil_post_rev_8_21_14_2_50_50_13]
MQPLSTPEVHLLHGHATTTSLNIAAVFEKSHKNVLQSINNMDIPEEFNRLNFQPVEYKDLKGEMRPMYEITRDGFALLAMGFTGPKAMAWKINYIALFNAMEQQLENQRKDEIILRDARIYRLQDENSSLKSILMDQLRKDRRKGTRLTPEEAVEIRTLFSRGYTKAEISRRTGRSTQSINKALNAAVAVH